MSLTVHFVVSKLKLDIILFAVTFPSKFRQTHFKCSENKGYILRCNKEINEDELIARVVEREKRTILMESAEQPVRNPHYPKLYSRTNGG